MPAIQPEQLERQINDLLELVDDPAGFIRACVNLLDYYADRTKRPRGSAAKVEIAQILRIPRPVMKMLCVRIRQAGHGEAENWLAIARGLWRKGIRETRQVAACALEKTSDRSVPELVEEWAILCEDDQAMEYVTSGGLRTWRGQDHQSFYQSVGHWLEDGRVRVRHLAIQAMLGRVLDDDFQELPQMLDLLAGLSQQMRGTSLRSLMLLIRHLAEISPPEVAKFLIEEVKSDAPGARRLAQNTLSAFPGRLQQEIRQALG